MILKLAWRNLGRNRRRTLITGGAIAMGLAMLVFSSGTSEGVTNTMISKGSGSAAGTVVVQAPGWQEERKLGQLVQDSGVTAARLAEALPEAVLTRRVFLRGLITSPSGSAAVSLTAVDPLAEAQVNDLDDRLVEGGYLDEGADGIVLGRTLAETLGVGIGDKVVVLASGSGEMASQLFRVRGIFATGLDDIDALCGQITLVAAQEMLQLGDGANQVAVHMPSTRDTRRATREVERTMGGTGLTVLPWHEALPQLAEYAAFYETEIYVMFAIMFAMVALGIVNTVLMSVLERQREFGVMLALGASPRTLATLVLAEAALLGLVSTALGAAAGVLMNWPASVHGWDLTPYFGGKTVEVAGFALETVIKADLDPAKVVLFSVLAFAVTVAAAVYPALRAARSRPVDALHTM
jgi:ABC-type lipoprotein release transport system permease subunit